MQFNAILHSQNKILHCGKLKVKSGLAMAFGCIL